MAASRLRCAHQQAGFFAATRLGSRRATNYGTLTSPHPLAVSIIPGDEYRPDRALENIGIGILLQAIASTFSMGHGLADEAEAHPVQTVT
jgi:hypothetical protein